VTEIKLKDPVDEGVTDRDLREKMIFKQTITLLRARMIKSAILRKREKNDEKDTETNRKLISM